MTCEDETEKPPPEIVICPPPPTETQECQIQNDASGKRPNETPAENEDTKRLCAEEVPEEEVGCVAAPDECGCDDENEDKDDEKEDEKKEEKEPTTIDECLKQLRTLQQKVLQGATKQIVNKMKEDFCEEKLNSCKEQIQKCEERKECAKKLQECETQSVQSEEIAFDPKQEPLFDENIDNVVYTNKYLGGFPG
jgi:hypothetical protein